MRPASRDVGLGTFYERWAIYERLARWAPDAASALEGPADGMAGIPGLHLLQRARQGARVTVVHPEAEARGRVATVYAAAGLTARLSLAPAIGEARAELVVGFNFAPYVPEWRAYLATLAAASERWLAIFVTHPHSYGAWIRRGLRRIEPGPVRLEQFDLEASRPSAMRAALEAHGRVVDEAYVDCPWWPDLFVAPGETLLSASLGRLRGGAPAAAATPYDFGPEDFPFARPTLAPRLARALRRHPGFDRVGGPLAGLFAHHRAYLVRVDPPARRV